MGFVILFVASWAAIFIVYSMKKSLSLVENTFLYLVIFTISIHIAWIVAEELKLILVTKDGMLYAGFIIQRTVTLPLIYVIAMNAVFGTRRTASKLLSAGAAAAAIVALNGVMLFYGIVVYNQWFLWYDVVQALVLLSVSYILLEMYKKAINREVKAQ